MPRPSSANEAVRILGETFADRPFTPAMAAGCGVRRSSLRQAQAQGLLERPHDGVLAVAMERDAAAGHLLMVRALLLRHPGAVTVLDSAVLVHALPTPSPTVSRAHVSRPGATYRTRPGFTTHHSPLPGHHVTSLQGLPVTTLERTTVDIARRYRLPRALIVVDAALRRIIEADAGVDPFGLREAVRDPDLRERALGRLRAVAKDLSGWPGIVRAREALLLGDPASESPLESCSRGTWPDFGIPMPACGVPLVGADGQTYWVDHLWEEYGVIGECDGMLKYDDPDALRREKRRQEALEQAGWIVVRWTWDDIIRRPHVVAMRIREAFARARRLRSA